MYVRLLLHRVEPTHPGLLIFLSPNPLLACCKRRVRRFRGLMIYPASPILLSGVRLLSRSTTRAPQLSLIAKSRAAAPNFTQDPVLCGGVFRFVLIEKIASAQQSNKPLWLTALTTPKPCGFVNFVLLVLLTYYANIISYRNDKRGLRKSFQGNSRCFHATSPFFLPT